MQKVVVFAGTSSTQTTSTSTAAIHTTSTISTTSTTTSTTSTTPMTTSTTSTTSTTTSTTSTTTTTTATTTPSCSNPSSTGRIFNFSSATAPSTYTLYAYGFNAPDSSSTLTFAMTGDSGRASHYWLLDSVSVNHTNASTNLLINGGFDMGNFTGWTQYCATDANCGGSGTRYGQLTTGLCYSGTYCYVDKCSASGRFDYLTQSFSTVSGDYYLISFYFKVFAQGGSWSAYVMLT